MPAGRGETVRCERFGCSRQTARARSAVRQQILRDATLSDMNGLAKQYLHPENAVILVVGNKYVLKDRLEKLGYGKVKEVYMD